MDRWSRVGTRSVSDSGDELRPGDCQRAKANSKCSCFSVAKGKGLKW